MLIKTSQLNSLWGDIVGRGGRGGKREGGGRREKGGGRRKKGGVRGERGGREKGGKRGEGRDNRERRRERGGEGRKGEEEGRKGEREGKWEGRREERGCREKSRCRSRCIRCSTHTYIITSSQVLHWSSPTNQQWVWEVQTVEIFQQLLLLYQILTGLSTSACQLLGLKSAIQGQHGVPAAQTVGSLHMLISFLQHLKTVMLKLNQGYMNYFTAASVLTLSNENLHSYRNTYFVRLCSRRLSCNTWAHKETIWIKSPLFHTKENAALPAAYNCTEVWRTSKVSSWKNGENGGLLCAKTSRIQGEFWQWCAAEEYKERHNKRKCG